MISKTNNKSSGVELSKLVAFINAEKRAVLILLAVMALEAYAIFASGAYFLGPMTLCTMALWLLAIAAIFNDSRTRFWSRRIALPLSLLTAFWLWTGASMLWSISPSNSWIEFSRTGGYLATFIIGICLGRYRSVRNLAGYLFLLVAAVAAAYALGTKVAPSIVDNLNDLGRVSVPIGYANGIGLLLALPVPLAIHLASAKDEKIAIRMAAAAIAPLLLISLFFTLSRGAIFALIAGLLVFFLLTPMRQRSFYAAAIIFLPVAAVAKWSAGQKALIDSKIDLHERIIAAGDLRFYLLLALTATVGAFAIFLFMDKRVQFSPKVVKVSGSSLLALIAVSALLSGGWFLSSVQSPTHWAAQKIEEFTTHRSKPGADRLLSVGSPARYQLWREAVINWQKKQIAGSGAQSFPLVHLQLRPEGMAFVKQAHGLFLSWLTELGAVGFILGLAFVISATTFSIQRTARLQKWTEKGLAASLIALGFIYLLDTNVDWDWNIVAVTLPNFLFLGILLNWKSRFKPHLMVVQATEHPIGSGVARHSRESGNPASNA